MNYLAHAYLSFNNPAVLAGNMISDFVKGKKQFEYPESIQTGIRLHRAIDDFTDRHASTAAIKEFFRPHYRLYSGAFTDISYDYFLANDRKEFENSAILKDFSTDCYQRLKEFEQFFPEGFARMFPYMQQQDWLANYASALGIEKSFEGLVRRSAYLSESTTAFKIFSENLQQIQPHYDIFFPALKQFAADTLEQFLKR